MQNISQNSLNSKENSDNPQVLGQSKKRKLTMITTNEFSEERQKRLKRFRYNQENRYTLQQTDKDLDAQDQRIQLGFSNAKTQATPFSKSNQRPSYPGGTSTSKYLTCRTSSPFKEEDSPYQPQNDRSGSARQVNKNFNLSSEKESIPITQSTRGKWMLLDPSEYPLEQDQPADKEVTYNRPREWLEHKRKTLIESGLCYKPKPLVNPLDFSQIPKLNSTQKKDKEQYRLYLELSLKYPLMNLQNMFYKKRAVSENEKVRERLEKMQIQ